MAAQTNNDKSKKPSSNIPDRDPIQVYCRLRPLDSPDDEYCITVKSSNSLTIYTPECCSNKDPKESTFTFEKVYNWMTPQKTIFDEIARPLIQELLEGKSALLFAYGVTNSGKTYTMSGTPSDPGIIPRVFDVLFNSIAHCKAPKYSFKSDHMNGFDAQTKAEIMLDRQKEMMKVKTPSSQRSLRSATNGFGSRRIPTTDTESEEEERAHDMTILPVKDPKCVYSVFVTYVELYNNYFFDLLEKPSETQDVGKKQNEFQSKRILRNDAQGNKYISHAEEVEVTSAGEALKIFKEGTARRICAATNLNKESSRSHSIFTVRLVYAPLDPDGDEIVDDKRLIQVSQLSLVDLAGSERHSRTQNFGKRLVEAGQINGSLMSLRHVIEQLRKKQRGQGPTEMVNYRNNKLTDFLKSYFEGQGSIRMILCINPKDVEYDESILAFDFAEKTNEIQIARRPPPRVELVTPTPKRKANANTASKTVPKKNKDENAPEEGVHDIGMLFNMGPPLPLVPSRAPEIEPLHGLRRALKERMKARAVLLSAIMEKRTEFRNLLVDRERELVSATSETAAISGKLSEIIEEKRDMENVIFQLQAEKRAIESEKMELEKTNDTLLNELANLREENQRLEMIHRQERNQLVNDMELQRELDKMNKERQFLKEEAKLKAVYKEKDKTIAAMKELVSHMDVGSARLSRSRQRHSRLAVVPNESSSLMSTSSESDIPLAVLKSPPPRTRSQGVSGRNSEPKLPLPVSPYGIDKSEMAVTNMRRSRSQAATKGKWLEHTPTAPLKSNTIFQPILSKKKSVNKLVNADDLARKTSNYCLRTDIQDSEGEVETHLYKGDVLPTTGGGFQVVLTGKEILKESSPTCLSPSSSHRKRVSGTAISDDIDRRELADKCTTGVGYQCEKRSRMEN